MTTEEIALDVMKLLEEKEKTGDEHPPPKPEEHPQPKCPKCGAFVEIVEIANDERLPGVYCNKEGCGWSDRPAKPPIPLRSFTAFLSPSVVAMIKAAPMNELARAQIHAAMLAPIPRSCTTVEAIVDWVQCYRGNVGAPIKMYVPNAPPRQPGLSCPVMFVEVESGRCDYTVSRYGREDYDVPDEDMAEMANDCNSLRALVGCVRDHLIESAGNNPPETEDDGRYQYDDYEQGDVESNGFDIEENLERIVRNWMENHMPDRLEELES